MASAYIAGFVEVVRVERMVVPISHGDVTRSATARRGVTAGLVQALEMPAPHHIQCRKRREGGRIETGNK